MMLDCISIKWPFVPATQRLEIHKQLTQTNPRRASVLGVSVIRKRLIAVPALTCAAAINTDIKIDAGRHPALTPLLFFFVLTLSPPFFPPLQCPPSPPGACRPSRSTRRLSVSRGQPPTLSSSTASTRATRSATAFGGSTSRPLTELSELNL